MRTVLSILCYTVSIIFGGIGFVLVYLGTSFTNLGDLISQQGGDPPE